MTIIKTIVFDWDGTIVDSVQLKHDIWFDIFPRHTKAYFAMQKLLSELKTSTRSQILKKVFDIMGDESNMSKDEFVVKYSSVYGNNVEKGILEKGFLPGAKGILESLHVKVPLYVNSATPIDSLLSIMKKMNAEKYFKGIYGRSLVQENHTQYDLKVENLRDIVKKENIKPKEIIVVGDAEADEKSAKILGCKFFKVNANANLKDLEKVI